MTGRLTGSIAAGTLLIAAAMASAQPVRGAPDLVDRSSGLTLAQAVARAIEREPSLRAARADVEAARGLQRQAALPPNPMVSFAQQHEAGGTGAQSRVDLQWPLELFRRPSRVRAAGREADTAERIAAARIWTLASEVRAAYGEVAWAARELSLSDEVIGATGRQLALVAARVEQGAAPALDRDVLSVELQRLRIDRLLQQAQAAQALLALKRLLGLDPGVDLRLADDLDTLVAGQQAAAPAATIEPSTPAAPAPAPAAALAPGAPAASLAGDRAASVADDRADVQVEAARLAAAAARIEQARDEGRADVSLFGGYMRTDTGFPQRGLNDAGAFERVRGTFHDVAAGVSVTIPIRNRNEGRIAAAVAERDGASARLDAARLTARTELASAQARDAHAREAVAAYDAGTRALARRNLDVAVQAYELGRMTLLESLAERRRYLEVEGGYGAALREAFEARQALTRALGERP